MENIKKLILQRRIEDINTKHYDLEREVNLLFDEIQYNLTETIMFEEPVAVNTANDFDNQNYITTIFGIAKDEILSVAEDVTHLEYSEIDKRDLTEVVFDYITLQDKIYLLEHIIDNLKD